jgi:hypothetical protein
MMMLFILFIAGLPQLQGTQLTSASSATTRLEPDVRGSEGSASVGQVASKVPLPLRYSLSDFPQHLVALHMPCAESNVFHTKCE